MFSLHRDLLRPSMTPNGQNSLTSPERCLGVDFWKKQLSVYLKYVNMQFAIVGTLSLQLCFFGAASWGSWATWCIPCRSGCCRPMRLPRSGRRVAPRRVVSLAPLTPPARLKRRILWCSQPTWGRWWAKPMRSWEKRWAKDSKKLDLL